MFDLDGTLLRERTVCEVLAAPLGRSSDMVRIEALTTEDEITAGRLEMAEWYRNHTIDQLTGHLSSAKWAPGAREAVKCLQKEGAVVAIASYTWRFAVKWFAEQLNVVHYLGTDLSTDGEVLDVWGRDKATLLTGLKIRYGLPKDRTAAVGDTRGDAEMLAVVGLPFFVGSSPLPESEGVIHMPGADLRDVADRILTAWLA